MDKVIELLGNAEAMKQLQAGDRRLRCFGPADRQDYGNFLAKRQKASDL